MTIQEMPVEVLHEMVHESTISSARLEGREIPADYVRPAKVQDFLDSILSKD
ncbi:MAG TPA: hypothetical protein PJ992_12180 [Arachnia sp.]|jgi:hypothetical protein|nr:hypothetical protein [Arachnia sp.]